MIQHFKLIAYGVAALAVMSVLAYGKIIYNRAQRVPELEQRVTELDKQLNSERNQAKKALEDEGEIRKQLAASDARANSLARRLRDHIKADLSSPAAGPAEPAGTSGNGSGDSVDILSNLLGACQRDAIRLNAWIDYYRNVPDQLK